MDWNLINRRQLAGQLATRKKKTDSQGAPVAFEWQIDLCNRTKKHFWINVPHEASAWTRDSAQCALTAPSAAGESEG